VLGIGRWRRAVASPSHVSLVHPKWSVAPDVPPAMIGHPPPRTISKMARAPSLRLPRMLKAVFFWMLSLVATMALAGNCAAETGGDRRQRPPRPHPLPV
jgi:hypothetical protein